VAAEIAYSGVKERVCVLCCCHQEEAPHSQLRDLRGQLNAERAELNEAQDLLVTSRAEESQKRELAQQRSEEDKTLGELDLGPQGGLLHLYCAELLEGVVTAVGV